MLVETFTKYDMHPRFFDWERWLVLPAYALVFLLSVYPMVSALLYFKATLLAVVLATVAVVMLKTLRSGLDPSIVAWTFSLSALGFFFILEGMFAGHLGASRLIGVYVIWPVLYLLMIAGVRSEAILRGLIRTLLVATICIAAFSIVYMLIQIQVLPENRYYDLVSFDWDAQGFSLHEGYLFMQYPGVGSLVFLVPFLFALLVTVRQGTKDEPAVRRIWLWLTAFAALQAVLVSGRRALILVTLTAPFFTLFFLCFQPAVEKRSSRKTLLRVITTGILALAVSLVCLNSVSGITLSGLYEKFSVAFNFSPTTEDNGANERHKQFRALLAGWMEHPILGEGHGAPAYGSIQSPLQPWSYELKYMALLNQTGILGFTAYAAGICWIYCIGFRVIRAGGFLSALMVACLTGMSSALIAHATNPYLDNFDGMRALFFPLAVVNFSLVKSRTAERLASTFAP